ncbi:helix-turn-helix domain-containing protein [Paenibacillus zanthoxyli]|uniref:helix-turn-helix domain-containing protein n=1 Tax=Paenibacillus zanthoxyli TaxID=369399 RepID=UPI00047234F6|nr:helix-turn-helix domain-containing protein [Paenibacillus zanthoxyli]
MSTLDFIETLKSEVSEDVFVRLMDKLEPLIQQKLHHNAFSTQDAAAYLGCSDRMLQLMCKRGEIKFYKIGTDYRFRQKVLDEWIAEQEKASCSSSE